MRRSLVPAAAAVALTLGGHLAVGPADAQDTGPSASGGQADDWTPPTTPWGDPDLRGIWPISHLIGTPLQRPEEYGERRYMTDEEFAEQREQVAERNSRYEEEQEANSIGGGHWAEPTAALRLTSLLVYPPDGRFPELTEYGEKRSATMGSSWSNDVFDWIDDFDSWDRCISRGLPVSMLPRNYNNGIRIWQAPGYVVIDLEMIDHRIIPVDGRPQLDSEIEQWMGASRGHWEDDTLVVETTNFNGRTGLTNVGVPGSPRDNHLSTSDLRVVERFTRTGPETIEYRMTVEDPAVLEQPFTIQYPMKRDDSYEFFEYACHEGNTAIRNYIETSRYERAEQADEQ